MAKMLQRFKIKSKNTINFLEIERDTMVKLDFKKGDGILPAIAQDYKSGKILMLAFMNNDAWQLTLQTGEAHYWSRTRGEIWHKGATSGNIQIVKEIFVDCDYDTILLKIEQLGGAACHLGYESCFHNKIDKNGKETVTGERIFDPERVYRK
jgi:phosphoribosyl-AMP cyclohydrolase